jgi:carbamate kinase
VPRRGYRRVVAGPRPLRVLEAEVIGRIAAGGGVVVACGGGGVPVVDAGGAYQGVDALVDRDLAAETLATALGAERLVLLTGVERVAVNYGQPGQLWIERLTVAEARALLGAGEFAPGSMGPKVEAGIRFVEAGGREAIITSMGRLPAGLAGDAGTHLVP